MLVTPGLLVDLVAFNFFDYKSECRLLGGAYECSIGGPPFYIRKGEHSLK